MNLLKDLFDKEILKYTIFPFIISIIFWGIVFFIFKDFIYAFIFSYVSHIPFSKNFQEILSDTTSSIIIIVLYYFSVISTLGIFTSFFIDKIVLRINEKYYHCDIKETELKDSLNGIWVSIKAFLIYFIIFIFTFFLLFIPVINIIYELFLLTVLNKKPLIFDSSYLFIDAKEIEKDKLKVNLIIFFSSLIYFIPFISFFGYTFQLILVTHLVLKKCKGK